MNRADVKIGKYYLVTGKKGIQHCLTPGAKVKVTKLEHGEFTCVQENWVNKIGVLFPAMSQWVDPQDLAELPKKKFKLYWNIEWPFKKHLYREDGVLYLTRYTLLRLPFLRIRLHHIWISDNFCLHDHPWHFLSVILKGGYTEVTELKNWEDDFKKFYGPGSFLFRNAKHKHRVELAGKTCWSLLFMIPVKRDWGFWKGDKFTSNTEADNLNCEG